ncbi:MAG: serine/threonine protein kinase, partial [Pseudonocardiales bacterium]|nr:serine/threonine protein kinase [Pseudonocardiales bacterium]
MQVDDRYEVGERIGAGGSGTVFRALDLRLGRAVAIKVVESSIRSTAERQQAEMRTMAAVTGHPNVVALYDAILPAGARDDPIAGRAVLVMELVDGPSLAAVLQDGPLPLGVVRTLGLDIAAALLHLQRNGIVHRDVKPANVLIAPDGRAKLADFGISQLRDSGAITPTGFMLGTSGFISPEQVEGRGATAASDVYALGLILLEAITGQREYQGSDTEAALARLARQPAVPAQLPAALAQLLADMVARDPAARPTAADVASRLAVLDLREAPAGFGAADDDRATGVMARPRKPGWLWPVAVAAALLVMVVVGAWRIALDGAPATGPGAGPRPTVSPAANTIAPPHGGPAGTAAA